MIFLQYFENTLYANVALISYITPYPHFACQFMSVLADSLSVPAGMGASAERGAKPIVV
jgi:hypothetical protein